MNKKKMKGIAFAIVLILVAVYLIISRLGYAPAYPFFTIVFSLLFAYTAVSGFLRLHFTEGFLSLAILGCIHDEALGIETLTPWTLLLAALLLGIAFDMLFKGLRKKHGVHISEWNVFNKEGKHIETFADDGDTVHLENCFGSVSKYVNSENFRNAHIENSFGECSVYFNNAILAGGHANVRVENNFGETNVFLPRTWQVQAHQDCAFGNVNIHGNGSVEPGAPVIDLQLESNFGQIEVFFE